MLTVPNVWVDRGQNATFRDWLAPCSICVEKMKFEKKESKKKVLQVFGKFLSNF